MNTLRLKLLTVADAYAKARKLSRSRVSTLALRAGLALDRIAKGKDLTTASWERAMTWFHQNWPEQAEWPRDVERPSNTGRRS